MSYFGTISNIMDLFQGNVFRILDSNNMKLLKMQTYSSVGDHVEYKSLEILHLLRIRSWEAVPI